LTEWAKRAKAPSDLEIQLKSNMNPNISKIMAPNRIPLMGSIANDMNWPDLDYLMTWWKGQDSKTSHRVRQFFQELRNKTKLLFKDHGAKTYSTHGVRCK